MQSLLNNHDYRPVVLKILRGVDDVGVTSELKCRNGADAKGNKWVSLHDVFFGGDSFRRGLLAGHLPPLNKASDTKNKVIQLWKQIIDRNRSHPSTLPDDIVAYASRQFHEYAETLAKEKEATKHSKNRLKELQNAMNGYEDSVGAMPPGAKGIQGGGRREHSTNLLLNQPATYLYANAISVAAGGGASEAVTPQAQGAARRCLSPAGRSTRSDSSTSGSGSSTKIHYDAIKDISGFTRNLETLIVGRLGVMTAPAASTENTCADVRDGSTTGTN
jgi:hypothetical protein